MAKPHCPQCDFNRYIQNAAGKPGRFYCRLCAIVFDGDGTIEDPHPKKKRRKKLEEYTLQEVLAIADTIRTKGKTAQ
jgi:hypothetical protein